MISTVFSKFPQITFSSICDVCFQKISRPPPWRDLEILDGLGAQRPRKFQWGEGFEDQNSLPEGMTCTMIISH